MNYSRRERAGAPDALLAATARILSGFVTLQLSNCHTQVILVGQLSPISSRSL